VYIAGVEPPLPSQLSPLAAEFVPDAGMSPLVAMGNRIDSSANWWQNLAQPKFIYVF
jgi:Ataxin-2 C-terminal region